MQRLDRFLLHPNIQRLGGIQVLISAGLFAWGIVKGVDPLIAAGVILFAANLVLLAVQRARRPLARPVAEEEESGTPPQLARQHTPPGIAPQLQGRVYGPGAIRQGVAEQRVTEASMSALQMIQDMFDKADRRKCEMVEAEFVAIINDGERLQGDAFSGNPQWGDLTAWRDPIVAFVDFALGETEKQRLLEAGRGQSEVRGHIREVLDWLRERRDNPDKWESRVAQLDGPELDAAIEARRRLPSANQLTAEPVRSDHREFSSRNDGGELAQRCHMLAGSVERWVESFNRGHSERAERMVEEWLAADPATDPGEARRTAYTRDEKNWEADYRLKYAAEAKKLFDKAYEMGEIAKEHERLATKPLAIEFESVPKLFNEIAESLYGQEAA